MNEHGMHLISNSPDETIKEYTKAKIVESWEKERNNFIEEVCVAMRNLPVGKKITIVSKPISVLLERAHDAKTK